MRSKIRKSICFRLLPGFCCLPARPQENHGIFLHFLKTFSFLFIIGYPLQRVSQAEAAAPGPPVQRAAAAAAAAVPEHGSGGRGPLPAGQLHHGGQDAQQRVHVQGQPGPKAHFPRPAGKDLMLTVRSNNRSWTTVLRKSTIRFFLKHTNTRFSINKKLWTQCLFFLFYSYWGFNVTVPNKN